MSRRAISLIKEAAEKKDFTPHEKHTLGGHGIRGAEDVKRGREGDQQLQSISRGAFAGILGGGAVGGMVGTRTKTKDLRDVNRGMRAGGIVGGVGAAALANHYYQRGAEYQRAKKSQ